MLRIYERQAKSHCAPVFWQKNHSEQHSGSMTFIRTEQAVLGLTNAHVAHGLMGCNESVGNRCQVGGAYLDPARLIQIHPRLDLASFRLSDVILAQMSFLSDYSQSESAQHDAASVLNWPLLPPSEGDPVMYGGYPAVYRKDLAHGNVEVKFAWFCGKNSKRFRAQRRLGTVNVDSSEAKRNREEVTR